MAKTIAAALAVALAMAMAMPAGAASKKKGTQSQQAAARTQTIYTTYGPRTCGWNPGSRNPQAFLRQQARGCF
jgi:uncharacterized low-complexity protein